MRTLFTFTLLSAIAFSGVAVGQEDITKEIDQIALKAAKTFGDSQVSVIDLDEPAPSDAEIDSARHESASVVESTQNVATEYNQFIDQGVVYPENIIPQNCCCPSGLIAPVVYQEPIADAASELVGSLVPEGAAESAADAASSVVESPIVESAGIESAPVYTDAGAVIEEAPVAVQGDPIVTSTPSCGCNQGAAPAVAPTEGLISSSPVSYQSAPVIYSSPAPAAAAPCCPPARRGFFRRLMGR